MIASLLSSLHSLALFAADDTFQNVPVAAILIVVALAVVAFLMFIMVARFYQRCPSNQVLVIFGKAGVGHDAARCIHGGATFVWPLIQDFAWLSLEPMQIEIPLRGALSMENIRVNVPSVFTVAVGTAPELMQNAAIRLLGLNSKEIQKQAEDMIFGQLRQVIASMQIEDINRDRQGFMGRVNEAVGVELPAKFRRLTWTEAMGKREFSNRMGLYQGLQPSLN